MLKKLLSWKWWWAVGVVLLIIVPFLVARSCKLTDSYSVLKGEYKAYVSGAELKIRDGQATIALLTADSKKKDAASAILIKDMAGLKSDADKYKTQSASLGMEAAKLKGEVAPLIEASPKLKAFVTMLETRIVAQDKTIVSQDKIISALGIPFIVDYVNGIPVFGFVDGTVTGNLNLQRMNEAKIGVEWKRAYEGEHTLRLLSEGLTGKAESALRWERLKFRGAGLIAVAAGGFLLYEQLKGTSK